MRGEGGGGRGGNKREESFKLRTYFSCSSGMISNFPRGAKSGSSPAVEQSSESKLVGRGQSYFHTSHTMY